jgi:uncharacterized tellurite resistance protein B-like protein
MMLDSLKRLIGLALRSTPPSAASGKATSGSPPPELQVAAAALLLELAHADGEFSPSEQSHIRSALGRHFALDDEAVSALLAYADEQRSASIDHFQFTRTVAERYDVGQKLLLAEVMWGVILADGTIGSHEAYLIRKLSNLLGLAPGYLAEAKTRAGG